MATIGQLLEEGRAAISGAQGLAQLEEARVQHLGRSGPLVLLLRDVGSLPPEERGKVGKEANLARRELEALFEERSAALESAELERALTENALDVTLPGRTMPRGTLHLLTQTRRRIEDIFLGMGYKIADGPEIDSEYYNFTALNTPEGHPARSASDTFYLQGVQDTDHGGDVLLRTQTSPVQVRVMEHQPPPVYIVSPGRVYRRDRIDATHSDMFHQVEGLAVDHGLTLADLKGTIETFCKAYFGESVSIRLRTHFFPFTEPSVEADLSCFRCGGTGDPQAGDQELGKCRLCKGVGWIEMMGAGMVDPNVFTFVDGYDTTTDGSGISGFAFGMGVDRIAMLRHEIPDMRLLFQNDLRVLAQFA
jgi:phenylalanyl-tRNA synthetase alpha chain